MEGHIIRNDLTVLGIHTIEEELLLGLPTTAGTDRTIEAIGSGTDIDVILLSKGTGVLKTRSNYDIDIADDEDIINLKYHVNHLSGKSVSSLLKAPTATEDFYSIVWDDTNQVYTLVDLGGGITADSGLTKTVSNIQLGGPLLHDTDITGAFAINFGLDGDKLTNFKVRASALMDIKAQGNTQLITSSTNSIQFIGGSVSSYVMINDDGALIIRDNQVGVNQRGLRGYHDYSANINANDYPQKVYVDAHIVGQNISPVLASPGVAQHGYVISWDNTNTRFSLVAQTGGGGGSGGHVIESAGTPLTQRANLNIFNGLTAVDNDPDTDIKWGGSLSEPTVITGTTSNTLKFRFDSLGVGVTDGAGLWLANTTAAAAGAQQYSPSLVLEGQGWKTNATAGSQSVKWRITNTPVQGAANPSSTLGFGFSVNNGVYTNYFNLNPVTGNSIISGESTYITSTVASTALVLNAAGNSTGVLTLQSSNVQRNRLFFTNILPAYFESAFGVGNMTALPSTFWVNGTSLLTGSSSSTVTANTRLDVRGLGTTTNFIQRWADSANTVRATILDNGLLTIVSSSTSGFGGTQVAVNIGASAYYGGVLSTYDNNLGLEFQTGAGTNGSAFVFKHVAGGSAFTSAQNRNWITSTPSLTVSSGAFEHKAMLVNPTYNITGGTYTVYGFDYNPTLTSMTGATHIAFRATSGRVELGVASTTSGDIWIHGSGSTTAHRIFGNNDELQFTRAGVTYQRFTSSGVFFPVSIFLANGASIKSNNNRIGIYFTEDSSNAQALLTLFNAASGSSTATANRYVGWFGTTSEPLVNNTDNVLTYGIDANGAGTMSFAIRSEDNVRSIIGALNVLPNSMIVGHTSITASTRLDVRGIGTTTALALRVADSANAAVFALQDQGILTLTKTSGASHGVVINNAAFSGSMSLGMTVNGTGDILFNQTGQIRFTHSGSAAADGIIITNSGTFNPTSGYSNDLRVGSSFTVASGTATYYGLIVRPTYNTTSTYVGTAIGIDYNPALTSVVGLTNIAFRATSGQVVLGTTTAIANNRLGVRGIGTTTGLTLLLEDSAGTDRFGFTDAGVMYHYTAPAQDDTLTQTLVRDSGTGQIKYRDGSAFVTLTGTQTLTNKTLTNPKITDGIYTTGGVYQVRFFTSATPVNYLSFQSSDSGTVPALYGTNTGGGGALGIDFRVTGPSQEAIYSFYHIGDTQTSQIRLRGGDSFWLGLRAAVSQMGDTIYTFPSDYPAANGYVLASTTTGTLSWVAGGGATLTGSTDEIIKYSSSTSGVGTKVFSTSNGNLTLGDSGLAGSSRTITATGSASDVDILFTPKGTNGTVRVSNGRLSIGNSNTFLLDITGNDTRISGGGLSLAGNFIIRTNDQTGSNLDSGSLYLHIGAKNGSGKNGNIGFFTTSVANWQSMERGIYIADATTNPTGNPTGGGFLYSDAGDSNKLKWRVPGGTTYDLTASGGGSSAGVTNELQKNNGSSGFAGTGLLSSTEGDLVLGLSTTTGTTRALTADGSSTNISVSIKGKNSGTVSILTGDADTYLALSHTNITTYLGASTGVGLQTIRKNSATNSVIEAFRGLVESTGTAANGIGANLTLGVQISSVPKLGGIIEAVMTDVTNASEDFNLVFKTMAGGATAATRLTLNNTILNAASGVKVQENGVNISPIGKQDIFIPASAMWPKTTNGCSALAKSEITTSLVNVQYLEFDGSTNQYAQFSVQLPRNWDLGTVTFKAHWYATAGSGTVIFTLKGGAYSHDDPLTGTMGTAQSASTTLTATNDKQLSARSSAITISNTPASEDFIMFEIMRDASTDSSTSPARLLGITIEVITNAAVAA